MYLPVMKFLSSNEMIHTLFWTLLHSLWQGVLLAIVTGLILTFTKRSPPVLRYNLLCVALLLFITATVLTFYCEMNLTVENTIAKASANIGYNYSANAGIDSKQHIPESIIVFIKSNEDIIVLSWFLIMAFKCIRLLTGLRSIYNLKHTHVFNAGQYWNSRLKELAKKINVETHVRLLRSTIAKIPMVAGHFKPVILVPAAMLTTLPEKEIEAILLHELAHIRRKDYLVNMLQSFAEIIFFFNPAVLWISSLIRDERENCCDDIAMGEVKNKKQFIHALLSFEENNIHSKYAASFPGRKNHLVNRVKRIITNNNKTLNNMEKIFLASGILVTCLILVSFSQNRQFSGSQKESAIQPAKVEETMYRPDTVPKTEKINTNESRSIISTSMDGRQYKIVEVNGKVTELYVDNVKIADDKIGQYKTTIDKIHQQQKVDHEKQLAQVKLQQKQLTAQAEMMKQKELLVKEQMEKQADQMKIQQKQMMEQSELMKQKEQLMKENFEKQAEQMKMQQKELMIHADTMNEKQKLMTEMMEKLELMKSQQKESMEQSELMKEKQLLMKKEFHQQSDEMKMKQVEIMKQMDQLKEQQKIMEKKMLDSMHLSKPIPGKGVSRSGKPNPITSDIVLRLQRENLVADRYNFSLNLTNTKPSINGDKQPEPGISKAKSEIHKESR